MMHSPSLELIKRALEICSSKEEEIIGVSSPSRINTILPANH